MSAQVVLVAEDDEDILDLVALLLQQDGYDVVTARDGEEALRLAGERRPALALLDVQMPKTNGYEVTRRLRADAATRGHGDHHPHRLGARYRARAGLRRGRRTTSSGSRSRPAIWPLACVPRWSPKRVCDARHSPP